MDLRLLFAKVLFFTTALSTVGWTRFQNNVLLNRGISARDVGILKGVGLLFKLIGELACATVADKHDPFRVFIVCAVCQAYTLECIRSSSTLSFNYVLFIKFLRGITACLPTLTNTLSVALTAGTKEGYGQQRVYGSLAWGVGALSTGLLIDNYGTDIMFFFAYFFYTTSALLMFVGSRQLKLSHAGAGAPLSPRTIKTAAVESRDGSTGLFAHAALETVRLTNQLRDSLQKLLLSDVLKHLLMNILAYGVVMSAVDSVIFTSLIKDYHTSASFGGMYTGVGVLSCLPAFYLSTALIEKHGHYNIMRFAQCACALRLFLMSLLPSRWEYSASCLLGTQLLHGASFALFWATAVDIMYKLAPPDMKNVSLGILNALYFTIGGAIGNILWSFVMDRYHMHGVLVAALLLLLCNLGLLQLHSESLCRQIDLVTAHRYEATNKSDEENDREGDEGDDV
jgi:MFS transporter, PPP family, 3-phenylpropionic acid transporter